MPDRLSSVEGGIRHAPTDRGAVHSTRPFLGRRVGFAGALLGLGQVEHPEKLLSEHKVLGAKDLVGARIIQVGEDDLGVREQLAVQERLAGDDGPFAAQIRERYLVDELVARAGDAVELRAGILASTTFSAKPPASPTRIPPVCASPSMIERGRHHGISREMVVQVLFGQREVLDGPRELTAAKLNELVDPDPSHCGEHQPG